MATQSISPPLEPKPKQTLKRVFTKAFGFGAGVAIVILVSLGGFIWYNARPTPPKPWDSSSIKSTWYTIGTTSDDRLQFVYIFENTTDKDVTIDKYSNTRLTAVTKDEDGLVSDAEIELEYPIFLPSKHKARVAVTLPSAYKHKISLENRGESPEKRDAQRLELCKYIDTELDNLNGFRLFDETNRFEIRMPNGWHEYVQRNDKPQAAKR